MVKVKQTEDKELLNEILIQLKENDNYCPCALNKTPDTKCACLEFREMVNNKIPGECPCGRYIITITDEK